MGQEQGRGTYYVPSVLFGLQESFEHNLSARIRHLWNYIICMHRDMQAQQSQVLTVQGDVEVVQEAARNIGLIVYTYSVDGEDWNIHTLEFELHSKDGGVCSELSNDQVTLLTNFVLPYIVDASLHT